MAWRPLGGANCCICGEYMPCAIKCVDGPYDDQYVCSDCSGERHALMTKTKRSFPTEAMDIQYHGGMFHKGEW